MSHRNNECRIYVGNLPPDIRTKDIQDLFHKFGKVTFVDLKNRRGPPFAFVEFEDSRYVNSDANNRTNIHFFVRCCDCSLCLFRTCADLIYRNDYAVSVCWKHFYMSFMCFSFHHFNTESKIIWYNLLCIFNYFSLCQFN